MKPDDNPYRPPDTPMGVFCPSSRERRWDVAAVWRGAKVGCFLGAATGLISYAYMLGTFWVAYDFDLRRTIMEKVIELTLLIPAFFVLVPSLVGAVLGLIGLGLARRVGRRISPPAKGPTRE